MWLFTTTGFFSVVRDRGTRNGVLIRARSHSDLWRLVQRFKLRAEIDHTSGADYPFRIHLSRKSWSRVSASLCQDVSSYENFKDAVQVADGRDRRRHDLYLHVWSLMRQR